jgi:carbonic anhydrase/acetyltransferase-like protein (isoleucine patch superfamily)
VSIYSLGEFRPTIHDSAFVADEATVIGQVILAEHTSVWPQAVMRGDNEPIRIDARTNIQEGAVLHTDPGFPLHLHSDVTVGHQAMLHGCTVGQGSLIGIQAVVMNGAVIGRNCLVGAGALVTEGKVFPDNSLIIGSPARAVRELTEEDVARIARNTDNYVKRAQMYKTGLKRL